MGGLPAATARDTGPDGALLPERHRRPRRHLDDGADRGAAMTPAPMTSPTIQHPLDEHGQHDEHDEHDQQGDRP